MGVAAKAFVATDGDPPMFRRQDLDVPAWYWTGRSEPEGVRRAITGFAGTPAGVTALSTDAFRRLQRAAPEVSLVGEPVVHDWTRDRHAGGCYSALGPGQRSQLHLLRQPFGNLVLAGEHVNGTGTIAGAIDSGKDAALTLSAGVTL